MPRRGWEEMLKCDVCGHRGWVKLCKESDQSARIDDKIYVAGMPDGLKDAGGNRRFHCIDHLAAKV